MLLQSKILVQLQVNYPLLHSFVPIACWVKINSSLSCTIS
uniref:Uncharacterized protein n=1 Tax=Rhizophora mucronata TaxID=61149 RepID=A0A2P2Q1H3_RHIMU